MLIATRTRAAFKRRFVLRVFGGFGTRCCFQLLTCTSYVCGTLWRGTVVAEHGLNWGPKEHAMLEHAIQTCFPHFTVYYYIAVFFYFACMCESGSLLNSMKNHVQFERWTLSAIKMKQLPWRITKHTCDHRARRLCRWVYDLTTSHPGTISWTTKSDRRGVPGYQVQGICCQIYTIPIFKLST